MSPIRLLIVDDSATVRALIRQSLLSCDDIEVVGEAADPFEAREAIKRLNPDVITLDIEMPRMDGLSFLDKIMRLRPMPVIIVSTLAGRGADATIRALEGGAVDCIEKPRPGNENSFLEMPARIRMAARANVGFAALRTNAGRHDAIEAAPDGGRRAAAQRVASPAARSIIAIGASTGGVEALTAVLGSFPADCAPTVVVQHMPPGFTASFAQRLDRLCAPDVREAVHGAPLQPGRIYIAPGGDSHLEVSGTREPRCILRTAERVNFHCPSVDVLFHSVAVAYGAGASGLILTGMGRDGAQGLLRMREAGAWTIAQDEATSVVFGMPRAAAEIGAAQRQLALGAINYAALLGPQQTPARIRVGR